MQTILPITWNYRHPGKDGSYDIYWDAYFSGFRGVLPDGRATHAFISLAAVYRAITEGDVSFPVETTTHMTPSSPIRVQRRTSATY